MKFIRKLQVFFRKMEHLLFPALESKTKMMLSVSIEILKRSLLRDPKYSDLNRLEPYGFKVYSQNDEDGIIQEIFKRIGTTSKTFVEFGAGDGLENNTAYLLMQGWRGFWIEGSSASVKNIKNIYERAICCSQLFIENVFITKDNIDSLISKYFTGEIDLLSIDIDRNDYYIWKNIRSINPRVVIVEYNGKFPPPCSYIMKYDENHQWDGSDKQGMSLQSATNLGESLGYQLVGTNLSGVNAFFVR
ncbi:hypothetical protein Barb6_00220 [Bacteroidales bacterium Barb6]|nr:hypothetical protein Barb6_00220 [Bacteroidales bacterium Barb6]